MSKKSVNIKVKTILWILLVTIMLVIFIFSNQPATQSHDMSSSVVQKILEIFNLNLPVDNISHSGIQILHFIVRKAAHFSLYLALGTISFLLINVYLNSKQLYNIFICELFCFLYAASDEYHQTFIPGRSGEFSDVLLDSSGAFVGIIFTFLVLFFIKKRKNKKKQEFF